MSVTDAAAGLPAVRLVHPPVLEPKPLTLSADQQAVVDHVVDPDAGPLLVLAGPGTGKTATLVEALAARVAAGTPAERILVLTFSRKAAQELRARITARLGGAVPATVAWTFHSFCYALLSDTLDVDGTPRPWQMLSGPEQDAMVRDLLAGHVDALDESANIGSAIRWPQDLQGALGTFGFAGELRTLFARVRSLGLDATDLASTAGANDPRWIAAAQALDEYLDVLDSRAALDYTELVVRATAALRSDPDHPALSAFDLVMVDEYQDTDPGQVDLLEALALGRSAPDVVAVGDPDQSIYAFRGADLDGIRTFGSRAWAARTPASTLSLRMCRRSGPELVRAARDVARRIPIAVAEGSTLSAASDHRDRTTVEGAEPGVVEAMTFPDLGSEVSAIVDIVRRAHLDDGVPWHEIAVVVRSAVASLPRLQRALSAADVPVEVAADEVPVAKEPAVKPLLSALAVIADPNLLTPERARDLLLSPLGGADASMLRRIGRALRQEAREAGGEGTMPAPSDELIRDALLEPARLVAHDARLIGPVLRLLRLLAAAREIAEAQGTPHDILWALWAGTPREPSRWPRSLERRSYSAGPSGRAADRDLDAVLALFELASRADNRRGAGGVSAFLHDVQAQQIPGETLAERSTRGRGVRLLTAHRSKGLEWELVVVADVQEDHWPDLRRRGSLLDADRISADGLRDAAPASALLAEERRLFYVAITRAKRRVVVTAVDSADDDGDRVSRFVDELGVTVQVRGTQAKRSLTLSSVVADLRTRLADEHLPATEREVCAQLLARLAALDGAGRPAIPSAHPDHWWGLADVTTDEAPLFPDTDPLKLSASTVKSLSDCGLKWFLAHEANGEADHGTAAGFGKVIHALADGVATGGVDADIDALMGELDRVWGDVGYEAKWISVRERDEARAALQRFLDWHAGSRQRTFLASEQAFALPMVIGGRDVVLRGFMDRVELDANGGVVVVDFKTSKTPPSMPAIGTDTQLGIYQVAVREGVLTEVLDGRVADPTKLGGAELVQLRNDRKGQAYVQHQAPLVADPDSTGGSLTWVDAELAEAVDVLVDERFVPNPGDACKHCQFHRACPARTGRQVIE